MQVEDAQKENDEKQESNIELPTHREDVAFASVLSVFRLLFPKFRSSRILSAEWTWKYEETNISDLYMVYNG